MIRVWIIVFVALWGKVSTQVDYKTTIPEYNYAITAAVFNRRKILENLG